MTKNTDSAQYPSQSIEVLAGWRWRAERLEGDGLPEAAATFRRAVQRVCEEAGYDPDDVRKVPEDEAAAAAAKTPTVLYGAQRDQPKEGQEAGHEVAEPHQRVDPQLLRRILDDVWEWIWLAAHAAPTTEREKLSDEQAAQLSTVISGLIKTAYFGGAAGELARAHAVLDAWSRAPAQPEWWFRSLCSTFGLYFGNHGADGGSNAQVRREFFARSDREQVDFLLAGLRLNAALEGVALPSALREPTPRQLERARAELGRMRERKPGPPRSPETLAHQFTEAFGLWHPKLGDLDRTR